jgi:hypothetical protein
MLGELDQRTHTRVWLGITVVLILVSAAGIVRDERRREDLPVEPTRNWYQPQTRLIPLADRSATDTVAVAPDGAWSWFSDPRAVHHAGSGKTYVGWVDSAGDVGITIYDHVTGTSERSIVRRAVQKDDHSNPALLMRPDGRLVAFYSRHFGPTMNYRASVKADDIGAWGPEQAIPVNPPGVFTYTYSNPVQLSAERNRIYLFWRGGQSPTFSTSLDGDSWTPAKTLLSDPGRRPYVKVASNEVDEIHFAVTDDHPHFEPTNSIYHFYYKRGAFYRSDGTFIQHMTRSPLKLSDTTKVYDGASAHGKAWIWDLALDSNGAPILTYATFPSDVDHRYRYARWDDRWHDHQIVEAGGYIDGPRQPAYSGGVVLDHEDPSTVYLSRQVGSTHELERWRTGDGGRTWEARAITSGSVVPNVRPVVPRNHPGGVLDVLWMRGEYPFFNAYETEVMGYPAPDRQRGR